MEADAVTGLLLGEIVLSICKCKVLTEMNVYCRRFSTVGS